MGLFEIQYTGGPIRIGTSTPTSGGDTNVFIGNSVTAGTGLRNVVIGFDAGVGSSSSNTVVIGWDASSNVADGVAIGRESLVSGGVRGVAIGRESRAANQSVSIATESSCTGGLAVCVGAFGNVGGLEGVGLGRANRAGADAVAIGSLTEAQAAGAVAVGAGARCNVAAGMAFGEFANCTIANGLFFPGTDTLNAEAIVDVTAASKMFGYIPTTGQAGPINGAVVDGPSTVDVTTQYNVNGTKVVGSQASNIAALTLTFTSNAPAAADGSVTVADGNAITAAETSEALNELNDKLSAVLSLLQGHGLMA
jgi:hypothetical protein